MKSNVRIVRCITEGSRIVLRSPSSGLDRMIDASFEWFAYDRRNVSDLIEMYFFFIFTVFFLFFSFFYVHKINERKVEFITETT